MGKIAPGHQMVTVIFPDAVHQALKAHSARLDQNMSQLIRKIVRDYFEEAGVELPADGAVDPGDTDPMFDEFGRVTLEAEAVPSQEPLPPPPPLPAPAATANGWEL